MRLDDVARTSQDVAATSSRNAKITRIADLLRNASPEDAAIATAWLMGVLPQGRIGIGWATIRDAETPPATEAQLDAATVDRAFSEIAAISGAGSTAARLQALRTLFSRATSDEQDFLARLLFGEMRQGALEGIMADAVARASNLPVADVRRAAQRAGDLPSVAHAVIAHGADALASFGVQLFSPIQPMLAQPADDMKDAMQRLGRAALDWKLDGARVQVHRRGHEVRVYTRRLNEITVSVPEVVEAVLSLPIDEVVLDGEAIALRADATPEPFQVTMSRFGSRVDVERLRREVPLTSFFFDCLYINGRSLLDTPASERFEIMRDVLPSAIVVPRIITSDEPEAETFLREAKAAGHEGVVAKSLDASYDAGRRGGAWLKVKEADTLDLVVLAAEWGHGRRQGWLSNLHLGALVPETGEFAMLGKTFKGMTDAILEWQTKELLAREVSREGHVVHVRPELVVEIAFEGVQTSPRYDSGLALRFARLKRYRADKTPREADTIARVRAIHQRQHRSDNDG